MESKQSAWNKRKGQQAQLIINEKKEELVKLLRWILKYYNTSIDIDGFFAWEDSMGKQYDSMDLVEEYIKQNK